jgi:hypothetical protein
MGFHRQALGLFCAPIFLCSVSNNRVDPLELGFWSVCQKRNQKQQTSQQEQQAGDRGGYVARIYGGDQKENGR